MSAALGACHVPSSPFAHCAPSTPTQTEKSFVESDGHRINVDVYEPDRAGRHPAVILLHGSGGIHLINPSLVNRYAAVLAEQGIICFVVHYFDGTGNFAADDSVEAAEYFHWVRGTHDAVTWVRASRCAPQSDRTDGPFARRVARRWRRRGRSAHREDHRAGDQARAISRRQHQAHAAGPDVFTATRMTWC